MTGCIKNAIVVAVPSAITKPCCYHRRRRPISEWWYRSILTRVNDGTLLTTSSSSSYRLNSNSNTNTNTNSSSTKIPGSSSSSSNRDIAGFHPNAVISSLSHHSTLASSKRRCSRDYDAQLVHHHPYRIRCGLNHIIVPQSHRFITSSSTPSSSSVSSSSPVSSPSSSSSSSSPVESYSSTNIIIKEASNKDHLLQVTERLLHNTPIGSLTQASIHELKVSISSWYSQVTRSSPSSSSSSSPSTIPAEHSEALLRRLLDEIHHVTTIASSSSSSSLSSSTGGSSQHTPGLDIDIDLLNVVLDCWRLSSNAMYATAVRERSTPLEVESPVAHRCYEILELVRSAHLQQQQQQQQQYSNTNDMGKTSSSPPPPPTTTTTTIVAHPDVKSYNIAIDTYSKRGITSHAKTLLTTMTTLSLHENQPQCRPNLITYNSLLSSYANNNGNPIQNATDVQLVLRDLMELYETTGDEEIQPDVFSFSSVLASMAQASGFDGGESAYKAEELLRKMVFLYESSRPGGGGDEGGEWLHLKPNGICFSCVINAWAKSGLDCAADRAVELLGYMQSLSSEDGSGVGMVQSMTAVIDAYAKSSGDDNTIQAEALLNRMISLSTASTYNEENSPNTQTFTAFIDCLAQSAARTEHGDDGVAALKAEEIFHTMEQMAADTGRDRVRPSVYTYNAVINAWAKSRRVDAGERAEGWLVRMEEEGGSSAGGVWPDAITYASVIHAYANSSGSGSGDHPNSHYSTRSTRNDNTPTNGTNAERLLNRMITRYQSNELYAPRPNASCFSAAIDAYASSYQPHHALRLLRSMNDMYNDSDGADESLKPDVFAYNCAIHALVKAREQDGRGRNVEKAMEILEEMVDLGLANALSFTTVIEGLARWGGVGAVEKAEGLLERMWVLAEVGDGNDAVRPTAVTYTSVINAIAKSRNSPNAAESALRLLQDLEHRYESTNQDPRLRPNTVTYNTCLAALSKSHHPNLATLTQAESIIERMQNLHDAGQTVQPDVISLTSVISAWSYSDEPDAAQRAEDILERMQTLYTEGNTKMRPTVVAFGAVLHAWARIGNAKRAQDIVDHMERLYEEGGDVETCPNAVIYNTLINAWAKSGRAEGIGRAENILERMKAIDRPGSGPNRITYNSVLATYLKIRRDGAVEKAERLVREMEQLGDPGVRPDVVTYTTLLNVIANSHHPDKVKKVADILEGMERRAKAGERTVHPNTMTYSAVINMCAALTVSPRDRDKLQRDALVLAVTAFTKIQESHQHRRQYRNQKQLPNLTSHTYNNLFTVLSRFSSNDQERTRLLERTLGDCCTDGLLSNAILKNLQRRSPELIRTVLLKKALRSLNPRELLHIQNFPPEWSRHAGHRLSTKSHRATSQTKHSTGRGRIKRS